MRIRKIYHLVIQWKKITAIGLNSDFFHLILMIHCLFIFHYASKYNILAFFKRGCLSKNHPRRPVGSQSGREKRRDECFQVRAKEPLRTDSHRAISKNSSRCRLLIGHKKCFVLLCPIGEQFLLSSFREFVHDGYCLTTTARFVHQACACKENFYFLLSFLTRNKGTTDESKKRLGCY